MPAVTELQGPSLGGRGLRLAALAAAAVAIAVLPGCRLGGADADVERGRALFTQHCGACHTLAEAGTTSTIGPNLDASFFDARASGMTETTIEGVTRDQIANPRAVREGDPLRDQTFMPPNIVTGQDKIDVAAYVGSVAGLPDAAPPELAPDQLFVDRCGACHTFEAAGTQAEVGPDLDEVLPGQGEERVRESIVDPMANVTPGFEPGVMPSFEEVLSGEELDQLVQWLLENAGGGNGNDGGANGNGGNGGG